MLELGDCGGGEFEMCVGIAIIGIVPEDGGSIQLFGENGNESHDVLLSEHVPIELHNRSFKIEYVFPSTIRLDAPDSVCRDQAVAFGIADVKFGVAVLRLDILDQICQWLQKTPLKHDKTMLQEADLQEANLLGADLQGADLQEANLLGADLRRADLRGADLQEANLLGADLRRANLRRANLLGADLQEADLQEANLLGADLRRANLLGADLRRANLLGADLRGAVMPAGWTA